MGHKNETQFFIRQKGRTKLSDTKPEVALDEIATLCGFPISKPKPVIIDGYDFRPDRQIRDFYVEALGPYHFTDLQESKTRRRSRAIVDATGKRLLLIDAPLLTDKKYQFHVIEGIVEFSLGSDEIGRLYA